MSAIALLAHNFHLLFVASMCAFVCVCVELKSQQKRANIKRYHFEDENPMSSTGLGSNLATDREWATFSVFGQKREDREMWETDCRRLVHNMNSVFEDT